jgi:hypothetical protein
MAVEDNPDLILTTEYKGLEALLGMGAGESEPIRTVF